MPTPRKVNGNSGGGGFQKPNFVKESMTLKWNFLRGGGGGLKLKNVCGRGMDIFWNITFLRNVYVVV